MIKTKVKLDEGQISLAAMFKLTKGTKHSRPIPGHHLRGIMSVKRAEITEPEHPFAMLTFFTDDTAEITISPRVRDKKLVEVAFRHEIGHWVWKQFVPDDFKEDYSEEDFAKAYSETFRRGSKSKPEKMKDLWSINARQKWRNLALRRAR